MAIALPQSLATRLTLLYASVFVLFSIVAFAIFYFAIDEILDRNIHEDLIDDIEEFHHLYVSEGKSRLMSELKREAIMEDLGEVFFRLYDETGTLLFTTDLEAWNEKELDRLPTSSPQNVILDVKMAEEDEFARVASGPLGQGLQLQVGEALESKNDFMETLVGVFGGTFILSILLGGLAGWFMARQALQGIGEVSRAALDVAKGRLDRQVTQHIQGAEVEQLVDTFNNMVNRLRGLVMGMREMTDNIAHDLRSPLGRIRAGAEQVLSSDSSLEDHQKAAVETLEECDRLLHMINTTLDVAETEMGVVELETQETDISKIVLEACELYEPLADDRHIKLVHRVPDKCSIEGNTPYLQRMLGNLLENALKYTRARGKVDVNLENQDEQISITISDTGIGISPVEQSRVFDRYYRCDSSRSEPGCGLGLSLARAIARAHGGDISISSEVNKGSEFTITLPHQIVTP